MSRRASTSTIVTALYCLSRDIQSGDGVANAACAEAAERLDEMRRDIALVLPTLRLLDMGRAQNAAAKRLERNAR